MRTVLALTLLASGLAWPAAAAARLDAPRKPSCLGSVATIVGTGRADVLRGTRRADVIVAGAGNDVVYAGGGNDRICAGAGRDRVDGGGGKNTCLDAEARRRCDPPAARIVSATASEGNRLELVADRALPEGAAGAVAVSVNSVPNTIQSASVAGRHVVLSLGTQAWSDDSIELAIRSPLAPSAPTIVNRNATGCSFLAGPAATDKVSESATNTTLFPPARGSLRVIFISVDSPQAPAVRPAPFPALTVADGGALAAWAAEDSYGRLTLAPAKVAQWVRLPQSWSAYGLTRDPVVHELPAFVRAALTAADPLVDFSAYDAAFIVSTSSAATGTPPSTAFTAPAGGGGVLDGKEIRSVAVAPIIGHGGWEAALGRLLGLTHISQNSGPDWDPMQLPNAGQVGFTAWHKRKLAWLDPDQVRCVQSGTLVSVLSPVSLTGGQKAVVVPTASGTGIVIEDRAPIGHDFLPFHTTCPPGALVYLVDPDQLRLRRAAPFDIVNDPDGCNARLGLGAGQTATLTEGPVQVTVLEARGNNLVVQVTHR